MERPLVPVFLQESLLAFWLLITSAFGILHILFESLFLRQRASSFNLLSLEFPLNLGLLVALDTRQLPYPPRLEFGFRLKIIGIVNIGNLGFLLLYSEIGRVEGGI